MLRFEIAEPNQQGTCSATLINFWVWIWLLKTPCLVGCFLLVIFSEKKRRAWSPSSDSFMFSGSLLLKREIIFIYHHWLNALLHYWLPFLMKKQLNASCSSANHCYGQLCHAEQPGPLPTLLQQGWLCWRCWISPECPRARNQSNRCSSYLLCEDA